MTTPIARRLVATCLALLASLVAAPTPAAAQTPPGGEAAAPESSGRILNGHAFMPAADVPGALVTTSFLSGFLVGAGSTTATWQVGTQTLSGTFEYAGIGAVLGYEYAFGDYLSARVALNELIYTGTTGRSVVVVGSNLHAGGGAGLTFSLPISDSLRVGVLADVSYAPNLGLTIGSAVKDVINTCNQPTGCDVGSGNFFETRNALVVQPALAASWAPFPALGLTANAAYQYTSEKVNGVTFTGNALQLGLAADFDFRVISSVPVGLMVQFSWLAPSDSTLQHVTDLGGGIYYTGRKDLALGIQVISRRFAVTPDVNVSWSTVLTNIGMRYYF